MKGHKQSVPSKCGFITDQVMNALTNQWQTTSLIACQVVVPPDAIARCMENRQKYWHSNGGKSALAIKSGMMAQRLYALEKQGIVEKRKVRYGKNEYRLAQPKDSTQ